MYSRLRLVPLWAGLIVVALVANSWIINTSVTQAAAGINSQLNFQGRLLTASGAVVSDGDYNMRFKIYCDGNGDTTGTDPGSCTAHATNEHLLWTETWQNSASQGVTVKNGYFSIRLGSITSLSAVDWNQDTLWLSMDVGGTGTGGSPTYDGQMTPFKRLGANAYAFNSGSVGGLTSGQFVQLAQGVQTASTVSNPAIGINVTSGSGNLVTLQNSGSTVFSVGSAGKIAIKPSTDAIDAFEIKSSTGATGFIVDTTATTAPKIAVGAYTAGSTGGQFEITPYGLNRSGLVINGYNSGGSYGGNYIEVNSTYNPANPDVFRLQYNGTIAFSGGVLSTFGKTTASTGSTAMILRSGNVSGTTSNSGTTTLQSGDSSTSGNTGIVTVTSGAATSGNSGNIVVDSGTASGTKGSITIGTANAPAVTIGNNSNTNNAVNIAAGTTGGINLQAKTTVTGDLIVSNNNASITGTSTGNTKLSVGGTVNASNTGSQYGLQNDVSFNPSGASLSNIYGMSNSTTVSGSALSIGQVSGIQTDVRTGAGYTGTITEATGMWVGQPVLSGTNKIATYNGIKISGNTDNGGNTTGTIENNQIRVGGSTTAAGVGGTLNNYGINLTLATGNTSGTNNYGLYIQGNGNGSANSNYAIYSGSSAASLLTGALNINGSVALGDATADLVSVNGTIQGTSVFTFEGSGADANETILQITNPTADQIITLPDATGTICLTTTCAAGTSASFIQNQNAGAQTTTNYWISGTGRADTALQSPLIDTATGVALAIGTTNATAINLNQNTVLAAGKSLKVTGGNTASRPGSPTEGMVYYDTDTHQLLTYNNSKWVADRTDAIIVAASNSSQSDKDAADYVADGNTGAAGDGDQVQINSALTAASGKKVVLLAGTYTADATILIPNNTTLAGVGVGSLIQLADIDATDNLIENSDTTTGAGITIRDLKLDGQQSLQTGTITQYGMYLYHIGNQAAGRVGARISNVYVSDIRDAGIYFDASENNVVSNSTLYSIDAGGTAPVGIYNDSSSNNSFTNNTFLANYWGLRLDGSGTRNTTVTGNIFRGSTNKALFQFGATHSTITGNTFDSNTDALILYSNGDSAVSGNTFNANTGYSITLDDSSSNTITDNRIQNSGNTTDNNAIYVLNNSDSNTITDNTITDSSAVTTNYAIRIASAGSNTNYLSSNSLGSGTINDSGTGTVYGGQSQAANGDFLFRGANSTTAFLVQNANGTSTYLNVDSSTNAVTLANGTINLNASSNNTTNINTGTSTGAVNIGIGTGVKTITIGNAVNNTAVNIQAGSGTGAITMGTGGNTNFTIDTVGRAIFQATTVDNANFQVKNHDGTVIYYNVDETIGQNKFNGTVCIIGAGGCTQGTNSILTVQGGTFIGSGGSNTTLVTPATSYNLDARLVLDNLSYAANKSGVALGMLSTSDPSARGIIIADARATTDNNPTIGIYSPDESSSAGLGWDGSNTTFKLKTQSLNTSSSNLTVTSGNTNGSGTATGNVSILSGFGNGTNNSSGNIIIDSGAKTGTGTTGAITIAPTNASSITIGRATGTPPALTLQGGSSVSLASSNGTNSTTFGFTGSQAAGDITYNLDRTVAAGPYTICTTAVSSCGGTTGTYVALQGSFPGTTQTGTINVENIRANYIETTGLVPNVADGTNLYIEGTAQSATHEQNAGSFDLTVSPSGASSQQYNAVNGSIISASGNVSSAVLQGVQGYVEYTAASDTLGYAAGGNFQINNTNNGTIDYADALTAGVNNNSGGTIGVATGLTIQGAVNPSGTITTNTGIYINNQTAGSTDYGLYVEGADTKGVYIASGGLYAAGTTVLGNVASTATLDVKDSGGYTTFSVDTQNHIGYLTGDFVFFQGANRNIRVNDQSASNTAGDNLSIYSAKGNGTGAGGALTLQAGDSGNGATGNGGNVIVQGGAATSTNGNGGNVTISGGAKSGSGSGGSVIIKPQSSNDSTTAFQIQNASATSLFTVDTSAARLYVGPTAGDTVGTLLVLGNKTNAGDPTGVEGAMYYNSSMKQVRCYIDSIWQPCNGPEKLSWGVNFTDDFLGGNLNINNWAEETSGTGAGNAWPSTTLANRPGIMELGTGTTTTGRDSIWGPGNADFFIGGGEEIEFAINVPTLADGTNDYIMHAGLCDVTTADCNNGLYIEYDRATSTNWRFGAAKGGTRTETSSSTAVATGWHRFRIVVNANATSVSYYMDGTSLGSAITANIPDTNSNLTQQFLGIRKTAGTTQRVVHIDYYQFRTNLSSQR